MEKCLLETYKHVKETPFEGFTSPIIARSVSSDFVYLNLSWFMLLYWLLRVYLLSYGSIDGFLQTVYCYWLISALLKYIHLYKTTRMLIFEDSNHYRNGRYCKTEVAWWYYGSEFLKLNKHLQVRSTVNQIINIILNQYSDFEKRD